MKLKDTTLGSKIRYMAFGGISKAYYLRQLMFSGLLTALIFWVSPTIKWWFVGYIGMALIYPYSRLAYDTVVGFVFGNNVLIFSAAPWLIVKLVTLVLCYTFSYLMAPIGLVMLYYMNKDDVIKELKRLEELESND